MSELWASDVVISQPEPSADDLPVLVDLGGVGFTMGGIAHDISLADREEIFIPHFAPDGEPPVGAEQILSDRFSDEEGVSLVSRSLEGAVVSEGEEGFGEGGFGSEGFGE